MDIICVGTDVFTGDLRNISEVLILGGGDGLDVAVLLCFVECLLGELTGNDVISLAGAVQKVQRNGCELGGSAALQEEDLVVVRDVHQGAELCLCISDNCFINRRSMAHLHNGHAGIPIADQLGGSLFKNGNGQHGGACRKIKYSVHNESPFGLGVCKYPTRKRGLSRFNRIT